MTFALLLQARVETKRGKRAIRTRRDEQVSGFNHNKDRISVAFNEMGTMDQSSTADESESRICSTNDT
jgi:hypothetical protein